MMYIQTASGHTILVDDEDYPVLSGMAWHLNNRGYVVNTKMIAKNMYGKRKTAHTLIHRLLLEPPKEMFVDHINGDKLDNRRSNLRIVTPQQSVHNTGPSARKKYSEYKGVSYHKVNKKWVLNFQRPDGKKMFASFGSEENAATAYNLLAAIHHGPYARFN